MFSRTCNLYTVTDAKFMLWLLVNEYIDTNPVAWQQVANGNPMRKMLHSEADLDHLLKLYDDQFNRYLCLSVGFISKLKDKKDRQICAIWIQMLCDLQSHNIDVKVNRNEFFEYFIKVLKDAMLEENNIAPNFSESQQDLQDIRNVQDPAWLEKELHDLEYNMKFPRYLPYFAHWSKDNRTYVAAKALPQHGALIYMAVCKDPSLGWENLSDSVLETEDQVNSSSQ